MKKNFMAIASLLIAAMLLVVSCAPEAKVENNDVANDLVDVKLSVAFGKAVKLDTAGDARIQYKYTLTAKWDKLAEGKDPYGETTSEVVVRETKENKVIEYYKITESPNVGSLGLVTPGLWQVDVKGYLCEKQGENSYSATNIVVLEGSTTIYFGNGKNKVTVLVAPKSSDLETAKGTITINLEMQDLENGDKLQYKLDDGDYTDFQKKTSISGNAASRYESTINATTGYHTISFKITNKDGGNTNQKGGVTRSFYLLKGNDITITGSVTPSEFAEEEAEIKVLQVSGVEITLTEYTPGTTKPEIETSYKPNTTAIATATFTLPVVEGNISSVTPEYTWYWGPVDSDTSSIISSNSDSNIATITLPEKPGRYTLSCKVSCAVTIKNVDNTTSVYTIVGDVALQEFLVD